MLFIKKRVQIKHSIPERIRFKVYAIRFDKEASFGLEKYFNNIKGITLARANPESASLVIRYNKEILTKKNIVSTVIKLFPQPEKSITAEETGRVKDTLHKRKTSLKLSLLYFIGLSFLTLAVFVREVLLKKPLAQNFFSPLGLITAVSAMPLVKKGFKDIKNRRFTLETFLGASIVTAVMAGEAVAALEILWITGGGTLLQAWITERSRKSIKNILQITEKNTYILIDGAELEIPVDDVKTGDTVVLHTGEKISVDGKVLRGEALIDESSITGKSEPVLRKTDEKVYAGTFVRQGVIFVEAEHVGDQTYLSHILQMVEDSLENKAPIQTVADRLAKNLIKAGFAVTIGAYILTQSLWRAFSVMLVMACPCATILSASTAISAAINAAAKRNILIKGGRYLEEAAEADVVCFDKTGTLTTNEPAISHLAALNRISEEELLQLAYSAELHNSHPVALSIKAEAQKRGIKPVRHDLCDYIPGIGVRCEIKGDEILVGSGKLMNKFFVAPVEVKNQLEKIKTLGLTIIFIAKNRELAGVIGFANQMRSEAESVILSLKNDGVNEIVMVTGDSKYTALDLAKRLNISKCYYSVMPEKKADIIRELKNNGNKVLMVGDGINDALALAEADIGFAMGAGGSEVAIEAADIALVKDDISGVIYVRSLSHATIRTVHQNFWIATGSNIVGVVLGVLGVLSPVMAGLIHITHTAGIMANSSRLLFYDHHLLSSDHGDKEIQEA
ncbi:MAG: cation-translocating P-type ATPase [Deltaproteobacteria bacterium]|nr:cation-translocating P-type ATPase [Deltaproteobacteria bacterium]